MAHVGEEAGLQLVGTPEVIRLFIQLGIERDYAAIGILQFPIQTGQIRLPRTDFFERCEQFLVLVLQFLKGILRTFLNEGGGDLGKFRRADYAGAFRKQFLQPDGGSAAGRRIDLKLIHEPLRADNSQAHTGLGLVASFQDGVQIGNARAGIGDLDDEQLRRGAALQQIFHAPASGVIEGVAGDFRNRRRDAGLILVVEAEKPGNLPGTLPRGNGIVLEADGEGKDWQTHRLPP